MPLGVCVADVCISFDQLPTRFLDLEDVPTALDPGFSCPTHTADYRRTTAATREIPCFVVLRCKGCDDLSSLPIAAKLLGIQWFLGVSVRVMTRLLTGGFLVRI
jgi:hypothetical protein